MDHDETTDRDVLKICLEAFVAIETPEAALGFLESHKIPVGIRGGFAVDRLRHGMTQLITKHIIDNPVAEPGEDSAQ